MILIPFSAAIGLRRRRLRATFLAFHGSGRAQGSERGVPRNSGAHDNCTLPGGLLTV